MAEKRTTRPPADWLQQAVIARVKELGVTAYWIAQRSAGGVSENHVLCYLNKSKSMGSHKLQHVLRAIGLTLSVDPSFVGPGTAA